MGMASSVDEPGTSSHSPGIGYVTSGQPISVGRTTTTTACPAATYSGRGSVSAAGQMMNSPDAGSMGL